MGLLFGQRLDLVRSGLMDAAQKLVERRQHLAGELLGNLVLRLTRLAQQWP